MITVLFAIKSYIVRKGLISIMQNLNLEFNYEEIRNQEGIQKSHQRTEKQILFICPEDFPELVDTIPRNWHQNTRIVIFKRSIELPWLTNCSETIEMNQGKSLLQNLIAKVFKSLKDNELKDDAPEELSNREKIIMRELVLGYTNKEIADRLFISPHTVIAHRKNITGKLGIKSVPGLTIYAILHKLISEGDIKRATRPSDTDPHK